MVDLFNEWSRVETLNETNKQHFSPFFPPQQQITGQMKSQKFKRWLNSRKFGQSKYLPDLHNVNGTAEKVIQGSPSACIQ